MTDYDRPYPNREHDSLDCARTWKSLDGCPDDCDCACHSDDSLVWLADELRLHRD